MRLATVAWFRHSLVLGGLLNFACGVEAGPIFVALPQYNQQGGRVLVSGDGSTIAGVNTSNGQSSTVVTKWETNQIQSIGQLPGANSNFVVPYSISADGSVVVGKSNTTGSASDAYRWSATGGMQRLQGGGVANHPDRALGVSADGSIIVGAVATNNQPGDAAALWNAAGQLTLLQPPPATSGLATRATAISADGTRVAGWGYDNAAFLGAPGAPNLLNQTIPAVYFVNPQITADGQMLYATGFYGPAGASVGFYWTQQNGVSVLGTGSSGLAASTSSASAASADGAVIGGSANFTGADGLRQVFVTGNATIWDATHGFQNVYDLLASQYGLASQLAGWKLGEVTGVSYDGMVLVGNGTGPNSLPGAGGVESWLVDLRNQLANTEFNLGINGWYVAGQGSATTIADPSNPANTMAQLTTSSVVSLSQTMATPNGPFDLEFDYQFQSTTGSLEVYLGSTLLAAISAPPTLGNGLVHEHLLIKDPSLWNLSNTTLTLVLDPPQQSQLLLDNFSLVPEAVSSVPEPSSFLYLATGLATVLLARRMRQKR